MPLHFNLELIGYEEFQKGLQQLQGTLLNNKAQRSGVREIAKEGKEQLKAALPSKTGVLQESIGYKTLSKKRKSTIGAMSDDIVMEVGATRKVLDTRMKKPKKRHQTFILRFLNRGVGLHRITAKNSESLWVNGRPIGRTALHKGFSGKNYSSQVNQRLKPKMQGLFVKGAANVLRKHGVKASL